MIKNFTSSHDQGGQAILEIKEKIFAHKDQSPKLAIFFVSSSYNLDEIKVHLREIEKIVPLAVCTTSGEIANRRMIENSMTCQLYCGEEFSIDRFLFTDIKDFPNSSHADKLKEIEILASPHSAHDTFGILLIDGLSVKEEIVTGCLGNSLGNIELIGGSAGDHLNFSQTFIFDGNDFIENSAIFILINTTRKFKLFKSQHFIPTDDKFVITSANPAERIVYEINGIPATDAMCNFLNISKDELTPEVFGKYPLMINIAGEYYVRSMQQANEDKSITFFCAIEEGLVMMIAGKGDIYSCNTNFIKEAIDDLGEIDCSLFFECILRKLEIEELPLEARNNIDKQYEFCHSTGFYTYGEQYKSVHINQTITGVFFEKQR